jgi:cellulose synthase/poly-beta-1,6-N-acetylglucosamine synthase-like glycosyltransferase
MNIEAVTVCIDFSKQLKQCISNKYLFNRWIIATHKTDLNTIKLCEEHNIEYVCSERVFRNAPFAKGKAINDALSICKKNDWLVQIDADIKLPNTYRKTAYEFCKNKSALYGIPRFHKNKLLRDPIFRNKITDKKTNQITEKKIGNLGAIGYFQMWHSSSRCFYEEKSKTGEKDDIEFMLSFKPSNPKINYAENWMTLPLECQDVSGYQGHYKKHYMGVRNL